MRLGCTVALLVIAWSSHALGQEEAPSSEVEVALEPLVPPRVVTRVEPTYPASHAAFGLTPVVAMHVTVEPDGSVSDVHLEHPGDVEFDEAAVAAVREWQFEPAHRGETPLRARVRVEIRFHPPVQEPEHQPEVEEPHSHADETPPVRASSVPPRDVTSEFVARADADPIAESRSLRGASHFDLDHEQLTAAPVRDGSDLLSRAPGVYVARPEGDAVAQQIYLRGFDAEHGQDIELTLGGGAMPINQPSHIHGQGYADPGFIIPEVVRSLRVIEGVSDPRQGDFATAGSIDFDLGMARRGLSLRTTYGSFDTFRGVLLWAPQGEAEETFVATTFRRTDGFGANRAGMSGGMLGQWALGAGALRGRIHASFAAARSALAGFLRRDDIEAGRVDFLGVYDDPSARAQSAMSARAHLGGVLEMRGDRGSFGEVSAWLLWSDFRLQANYTGYVERSQIAARWVGRGDLIEQRNDTVGLGLRARYRTERFAPWNDVSGFLEAGVQARADSIGQEQNLLDAGQNETWDRRADAQIRAVDIGAYLDLDASLTKYVRLRGGARSDVLFYDVEDALSNFIPDERPETYIVGYRRSAMGLFAGPRATLEVTPVDPLVLSISYGEGFRSPQARQLEDGESAPFASVRSGDAGFRLTLGEGRELRISGAGYLTSVSEDTAFDPGEGRLERIGPTTRIGGVLYTEFEPIHVLRGTVSATYVHATLDAPPRPSIEDPAPSYSPGQALPFVPPWVLRADLFAGDRIAEFGGSTLTLHAGLGGSFLSPRPLPFGHFAEPVFLLDASVRARWSALELAVEVLNVLDARYAAVEASYASAWQPGAVPSRLPTRHVSAGAPLTVQVTLGVTL